MGDVTIDADEIVPGMTNWKILSETQKQYWQLHEICTCKIFSILTTPILKSTEEVPVRSKK